jgi:hypothetical protein
VTDHALFVTTIETALLKPSSNRIPDAEVLPIVLSEIAMLVPDVALPLTTPTTCINSANPRVIELF